MPLPYEDFDADRLQTALTRRFLAPALPALEAAFFSLRAETDEALAAHAQPKRGKPYPYGYCAEITMDAASRLGARIARPRLAGERALKAFVANGGRWRPIWGILRNSYFQNAFQIGSLYVDVSNDTVDVKKPKVEILPMRESGMAAIGTGMRFAEIAERYWGLKVFTNIALPMLAPLYPMMELDASGCVRLHPMTRPMMRLFCAKGFQEAEVWLRDGPAPPDALVRELRRHCPEEVLALNPRHGVTAAIETCQNLRRTRISPNETWMAEMQRVFERVPQIRIFTRRPAASERGLSAEVNARVLLGVS